MRYAFAAYGILCCAVVLATFVHAIGFVGNLLVPRSMDSGPATGTGLAILID